MIKARYMISVALGEEEHQQYIKIKEKGVKTIHIFMKGLIPLSNIIEAEETTKKAIEYEKEYERRKHKLGINK